MNFEDCSPAQDWLRQFDCADREVARQLLRKLILVSQTQFETELQIAVESVLARVTKCRENLAMFSITEPPSIFNEDSSRRVAGSSADRVKHLLENIARNHGERARANPTDDSMRAERIRNIVLVEDFIGSGDRITNFWNTFVSKTVKSWISYKWTKVWVVSYAAIDIGLNRVAHRIPGLSIDRCITVLPPQKQKNSLTVPMLEVAKKYGQKLRGNMWKGYSEGGGNIIFQHGCPNNVPAILWAEKGKFKPLFPDRGIPTTLQPFFGIPNLLDAAENLWGFQQYNLALTLIDHISKQRADYEEWGLIIALAIASRRAVWNDNDLHIHLRIPMHEVVKLKRRAYEMSLIDKQTHALTPFGSQLLLRLRRAKQFKKQDIKKLPMLTQLYYPDSCEGISKH